MHNFISIILLIILYALPLYSQISGQRYEVGQLRFDGNEELNEDQLLNIIHTRETPWVVWKWIYKLWFGKEILGGQKPEYFDPIIFDADYHQLKRYYEDNGFFHSQIDTTIIVRPDKETVYLTFAITEGRRSIDRYNPI